MRYMIVDDEIKAANMLKRIIERYPFLNKTDEIIVFNDSLKAYEYLSKNKVDLLFLDIQIPKMSGEELATRIKEEIVPAPYIVFITAFPQYSLFAWDTGAIGYIMKPYSAKKVYEALQRFQKLNAAPSLPEMTSEKPWIQCFPDFELLIKNTPIAFKSRKAKELLAFLVHNQGNWVSLDKITFCLFEDLDELSSKNYLRTVLYRLKKTLSDNNISNLIESRYGEMRVNTDQFQCDYYLYLNGRKDLFKGDYMGEYPWAQTSRAFMFDSYLK